MLSFLGTVGIGIETLKKASDLIAVIEKLKGWIMVQPKEAAAELAAVIDVVLKAPRVVNKAAIALLKQIDEGKPKLAGLAAVANGTLELDVEQGRPHCHEIALIAGRYLWQWLEEPGVRGANAAELRTALQALADADDDLFRKLTAFAEVIKEVAHEIFNLASSGRQAEALALLGRVAPALLDAQIKANEFAKVLLTMQIDFQHRALGQDG
jgi:hypothetical protein